MQSTWIADKTEQISKQSEDRLALKTDRFSYASRLCTKDNGNKCVIIKHKFKAHMPFFFAYGIEFCRILILNSKFINKYVAAL